jgi:hypothetical protein
MRAWRVPLLVGCLFVLDAGRVSAQDEGAKLECLQRHEDAQVARRGGQLLAARAALLACSREVCPDAVRADCVEWLDDVNRSIPSVVVAARDRGADVTDTKVFLDGELVATRLTGSAVEADPGEHHFRFVAGRGPVVERTVLMSEGVRNRLIDVEFAPPPAPAVSAVSAPAGPPLPWFASHPFERSDRLFGAVALAGAATAAAFGIWALVERSDASCAPFCNDAEVSPIRTKLVIADVGLGVAAASLAVGSYRYLTRPARPPSTEVQLVAGASGGAVLVEGRF